jgi:hypothetical protein
MNRRPWPKKPDCDSLTKKEVRDLLAQPGVVQDDHYDGLYLKSYTLPDGGELIVLPTGKGLRYPSRAEYIAYCTELEARPPEHVLAGQLPQGEGFPADVPRLIDELATTFGLPRDKLDNTIESLTLVDRAVRRRGPTRCMEPDIYPLLIAYVGEVMRQRTGGEWRMKLAQDGETWEPWIVAGQETFNPFMVVYRELDEGGNGSIAGATRGELRHGTGSPRR